MKKNPAKTNIVAVHRAIVSILYTAVGLYWSTGAAASKCYDEDLINHSEVPKCETSESIQFPDASKPTAAVFLSLTQQKNYDTILVTYNAIKKHSPLTKLNVITTQTSLNNLAENASSCNQDPSSNKKACAIYDLIRNSAVNTITIDEVGDDRYMQDFLQFYIKDGKVSLFPVLHPKDATGFYNPKNFNISQVIISEQAARSCEIPKQKINITKPVGSGVTMGGNVESLPSNIITLGDYKVTEDDEMSKLTLMTDEDLRRLILKNFASAKLTDDQIDYLFAKTRAEQSTAKQFEKQFEELKIIRPSINLTFSNHADETFSVVKSNAKCGFSVLIPSPQTAIEIMKGLNVSSNKSKCLNSSGPNVKTKLPEDEATEKNHLEGMCVGFRGKTYDEILKDDNFLKLNERLESFSVENMKLIQGALKNRCQNVDFIKVPYLIGKAPWGETEPVTPNLVNALVITPFSNESSIYINNPTFFQPFDQYLVSSLNKRGVRTFFAKDSDYFFGFGGYHCASSTIQLCK